MDNDTHKPFRVGWWILQYERAGTRQMFADGIDDELRYVKLRAYILRRIVRKYSIVDTLRHGYQPSKPGNWRNAEGVLAGLIERGTDGYWRITAVKDANTK